MLNHPDVTGILPGDIWNKANIPMVRYQLGNTARNNLLNYEERVNLSFFVD